MREGQGKEFRLLFTNGSRVPMHLGVEPPFSFGISTWEIALGTILNTFSRNVKNVVIAGWKK